MKKLALLFALLVTVVACDKGTGDQVKKNIADAITAAAAPAIATTLECSANDVIKADVQEAVYKVLKVSNEKSLTSVLCKSVVGTVVPQLIGVAINPKWECSATNVQDSIKLITDAACDKLQ